ncbi:DUF262 domain-containing protein [Psychrobacter sanguinis]|uniref:DUF262 domain-containing protein n=1 Tax=Psychrobacter sanguinis TaxID=861445 RepID=UPI0019195E5A|nr:DUF262 domain-containing protein [Psychrobacter sanguinis]UEC25534.1 DUF262 domain-containing protein [Psychrobacter sanguinis]
MYQAGGTIKDLLDKVAEQQYLLPAIQREFVWKPEQICRLFDSLLQDYPFGTFLFWKIKPENREKYQFYQFMQHYHERDNYHCENVSKLPNREFTAVLDGQQRITALNIGLRGSFAWKLNGKWWSNDDAFPVRYLYLNLLGEPNLETGSKYQFEFLTEDRSSNVSDSEYWFKVARIMNEDEDDLVDEVQDSEVLNADQKREARKALRELYRTIHFKDKIAYYEESDQSLEKVLNIFIRMNSGGTTLSYSDLLLSIAVAQWDDLDAREEIHSLVDEMNRVGDGFNISKDLVLKAGLMLSDIGSVGFKVENFNKENMAILEANWHSIKEALILSMQLLASYGFNAQNLRANSAVLPLAYYLYHRKLDLSYLSRVEHAEDRERIRHWLVRSMLKASGIWGSGLDTLLTLLRADIQQFGSDKFPVDKIESTMQQRGKSLRFDDEEIAELAELGYNNPRTFALLTLIFPGFDFSHHFHVDHIYPKGLFTKNKLTKAGVSEELQDQMIEASNRLPNLQLLEGSVNNQKRQKMPHDWYLQQWPNSEARKSHLQSQAISSLPEDLQDFMSFYNQRHETLLARIRMALSSK